MRLAAILLILFYTYTARAEKAMIAVAANFLAPMVRIKAEFEKSKHHTIEIISGSSGKLFAQIANGAPYDVFLSADRVLPKKLVSVGLGVEGTDRIYAKGILAVWRPSNIEFDKQGSFLGSDSIKKIAIANEKLAPYGRAAVETLKSIGVYEKHKTKLVMGENISQVFQFTDSGAVDFGFIALSQFVEKKYGSVWLVPKTHYAEVQQALVLLKHGRSNQAAQELLEFFKIESTKRMIKEFGYEI